MSQLLGNLGEATRENFLERWRNPSQCFERHIGKVGYEIPEIDEFEWHALAGENNWLVQPPHSKSFEKNTFAIGDHCKNNMILFGRNSNNFGRHYIAGSQNVAIILGEEYGHNPVNVHFHNSNQIFFFGRHSTSNTVTFDIGGDGNSVIVGEDCLFSAGIYVMTSDAYPLIDLNSGAVLNPSRSVHFEPHVCIGFQAVILKGVRLGFACTVAARAVVTRDVSSKSVVAGNPAKLVRSDASWVRSAIPDPYSRHRLLLLEHLIQR